MIGLFFCFIDEDREGGEEEELQGQQGQQGSLAGRQLQLGVPRYLTIYPFIKLEMEVYTSTLVYTHTY